MNIDYSEYLNFENDFTIENSRLIKQGNIVYYLFDHPISAVKNKKIILPDFPIKSSWWIKKGLKNKKIKIVSRIQETHEEIINYAIINCQEDSIVILPLQDNTIFKYIYNNEICWNQTLNLLFIYISCDEPCFITQKIMHDPSLFVDIDKNKIST